MWSKTHDLNSATSIFKEIVQSGKRQGVYGCSHLIDNIIFLEGGSNTATEVGDSTLVSNPTTTQQEQHQQQYIESEQQEQQREQKRKMISEETEERVVEDGRMTIARDEDVDTTPNERGM